MCQSLIYEVAGVDIREQKYIRITGNLTICTTLMLGSFLINSHIQGKRPVNDTSCNLTVIIHLCQSLGIYCAGHLWIHNLNSSKRSYLRVRNTAGVAYLNGVVYDSNLILKSRICHKCYIR